MNLTLSWVSSSLSNVSKIETILREKVKIICFTCSVCLCKVSNLSQHVV